VRPREDAIGILPALVEWAKKMRALAIQNNNVLSPESEVMTELHTIVAANPLSLVCGYNMACIDSLSTKDAALRCGVEWIFDAAHGCMDLYQAPVVQKLRDVFPEGSGRCSTTLSALRSIIERASPGYFHDVVGDAHDALCDAHVLRYYTQTVRSMWSCLSM